MKNNMKSLSFERMELVVGSAAPSGAYCALTGFAAIAFVSFGLVGIAAGAAAGIHNDIKACWNS